MTKEPTHIWYVSYASNMLKERFLAYVLGGTAPGGKSSHPGCKDHTLPSRDEAIDIPVELYFSSKSNVYDGSVAFIDPDERQKTALARAYLVTREQFWDIVQQENAWDEMPPGDLPTMDSIRRGHIHILDPSESLAKAHPCKYSRLVYLGEREDHPLLTFTTPERYTEAGRPSELYLRTVSTGLHQSRHITDEEIAAYLIDKSGVAGNYTLHELQAIAGQRLLVQ